MFEPDGNCFAPACFLRVWRSAAALAPQSVQSVPRSQRVYSHPGPPSSQSLSLTQLQSSMHRLPAPGGVSPAPKSHASELATPHEHWEAPVKSEHEEQKP